MKKIKKEYVCSPGKKSKIIIEDIRVKVREGATLIVASAGIGLLGSIIGKTLIDQIPDMEEIGFITSEFLPPISNFSDGILKHPFRLYYSYKYNIIVALSEIPFEVSSAYGDLAKTICNWALSEDVLAKEIVLFQGLPQKGLIEQFPVFYASQNHTVGVLENKGIEKVRKGIIVGPEASMINEALMNKLNPLAFFTPVYQIPTPEGAAAILEVLNDYYKLKIDTSQLIKEGKEIKDKMLELAEKAQQYQRKQLSETGKGGYTKYYQ